MEQDYPRLDGEGTYWYDALGFKAANTGQCFICHAPTDRLDINFFTYFCDSASDNEHIRTVLAKGGYDSDYDIEYLLSLRQRKGRE